MVLEKRKEQRSKGAREQRSKEKISQPHRGVMSVAKEKAKHYKRRRCAMSIEEQGAREQRSKGAKGKEKISQPHRGVMSVAKEKEKHYKRHRCAMSIEDQGAREQRSKGAKGKEKISQPHRGVMSVAKEKEKHYKRRRCETECDVLLIWPRLSSRGKKERFTFWNSNPDLKLKGRGRSAAVSGVELFAPATKGIPHGYLNWNFFNRNLMVAGANSCHGHLF